MSISSFQRGIFGPPADVIERKFTSITYENNAFKATWIDAYPGRLLPTDGQVLAIQRLEIQGNDSTWQRVAWHDPRSVEVRARKKKGKKGYLWEMRWLSEAFGNGQDKPKLPRGTYRVVLSRRGPFEDVPRKSVYFPSALPDS